MNKMIYLAPLAALALAGHAVAADNCEVTIDSDDMMRFDQTELSVSKDCEEVKVTLTHSGQLPVNQMGHNWVLAKADEWEAVAQAGMAAGIDNQYLPEGDERIIAHTDLIGGGESTSVTFDLSELDADEDYTFFCSFPGHSFQMKGTFNIE